MLQKEVAERLLAQPGNREIGFLTHLLGYHFDIRRGFHVGPGADATLPPKLSPARVAGRRGRPPHRILHSLAGASGWFSWPRFSEQSPTSASLAMSDENGAVGRGRGHDGVEEVARGRPRPCGTLDCPGWRRCRQGQAGL
jgi:hypothetical protein